MKITRYRIEAGHYETTHHVILSSCREWQVREKHRGIGNDEVGDLIDNFPTLRAALATALRWDRATERTLGA